MNKKILYIDASNIVDGGGLNHLKNILTENQVFENIIIWINKNTQNNLPKKKNIQIKTNYFINFSLITRLFWQLFILPFIIKKNSILYIPGGFFLLKKTKTVVFIQNVLPFTNLSLYKINYNFYNKIKIQILKKLHLYSINKADHVIFPSKSSLKITLGKKFYKKNKNISIIYHGVSKNFFFKKKIIRKISSCSKSNPFIILYISKYEPYKNHENLIKSINKIKKKFPIKLILAGSKVNLLKEKIGKELDKINLLDIYFLDNLKFKTLIKYYKKADIILYPSLAESFGLIVLEAMSCSLPIACSNLPIFKEITNNNAIYFNPNKIQDIKRKTIHLISNHKLRAKIAKNNFYTAKNFSWENCTKETINILKNV